MLETERLILRPWTLDDVDILYEYASDKEVGPITGWPAHKSIEESKIILEKVLMVDETYAIVLKETNEVIGDISLMRKDNANLQIKEDECEFGFWLGKRHWGHGYMPEAVDVLFRHAFLDLGLSAVFCGYYDGNIKSKRAQEKIGFKHYGRLENVYCNLLECYRNEDINIMTFMDWCNLKFKVNETVLKPIKLLGKGKGGYSYLVTDGIANYVLKQIHHEPCDYYTFGDKLSSEINDYNRLLSCKIRMPKLIDVDKKNERIIKEYIDGPVLSDLIKEGKLKDIYVNTIGEMARRLKENNLNIDYYPTNFVINNDLVYYVDYECNTYMEEWSFEKWGIEFYK